MKILFIYPDMVSPDPTWSGYFYIGLAYLSACVREAGHETELLHVHHSVPDEDVLRWVDEHREGDDTLIAFSSTTNQFSHVQKWAPLIKQATGLPTILGGMHATLSPEKAIECDGIDMLCQGDGEGPLVEAIERLQQGRDATGIEGIWFRPANSANGAVVRQGMAPLADVSRLPIPHWELYQDYKNLMVIKEGIAIFMASRGCPYRCAYCCNGALLDANKGRGKYLRFMDVPQVIRELKTFLGRYPECTGIFFEDDVFGASRRWLEEFVVAYKSEIGKRFGCNVRPNMVNEQYVKSLADAGCERVHMAIESGNEEIRNEILERKLSQEKLTDAFTYLKRYGIKVLAYNIVGSPHETPEAVLDTIKFNAEIAPDYIQHSILFPYEGTPVYDLVTKEGLWAKDRVVEDYFDDTPIEQESISRDQVLMFQRNFKPLVRHYQRIWRLPSWLATPATFATDRFLTWGGAPTVMRWFHRKPAEDARQEAAVC